MERLLSYVLLLSMLLQTVAALECYVCQEQEDNDGKCVKTVALCKREEDHCLSEVKWGSMPYWTQGAPKQYFISKQCATRKYCDDRKRSTLASCERIGYNDWDCAECCQGDRCNYFITLGSSSIKCSWVVIIGGLIALAFLFFK